MSPVMCVMCKPNKPCTWFLGCYKKKKKKKKKKKTFYELNVDVTKVQIQTINYIMVQNEDQFLVLFSLYILYLRQL
ncbi:hypothetical protein HanIR_Chr09g0449491 [Helianthus annuus]|nr:hypothetical protein HanIR_Chr09g0449491 [Helianthus annuus]